MKKTNNIEQSFINARVIKLYKRYFIPELISKSFNDKNRERLQELQNELLVTYPKKISETKNWVGSQCFKEGFWLWHGFDLKEAKAKVSEIQSNNGIKKSLRIKENPEKYLKSFNTNKEYWIEKGYSLEEAKLKVAERQITFSLDMYRKTW